MGMVSECCKEVYIYIIDILIIIITRRDQFKRSLYQEVHNNQS